MKDKAAWVGGLHCPPGNDGPAQRHIAGRSGSFYRRRNVSIGFILKIILSYMHCIIGQHESCNGRRLALIGWAPPSGVNVREGNRSKRTAQRD
jgi:hypothetical protein